MEISFDVFCGQPAFPLLLEVERMGDDGEVTCRANSYWSGLTKLEYMTAAMAMKDDPLRSAIAVLMELWRTRTHGASYMLQQGVAGINEGEPKHMRAVPPSTEHDTNGPFLP